MTTTATTTTNTTWVASVPGVPCANNLDYYISATGTHAGDIYAPTQGPQSPISIPIGQDQLTHRNTFDTPDGWTVTSTASDGQWTQGTPLNCPDRGAPTQDSDNSGACWLTDNDNTNDCNSDIDNGTTTLTSPIFSLQPNSTITYDYWFADVLTGELNQDEFAVDISTNAGQTWTRAKTITTALQAWRTDSITFDENFTPTDQFQIRFSASDEGVQNVAEAALDNFRITQFICTPPTTCAPDLNQDNTLNFFDVSLFLNLYASQDPRADIDQSGTFNFFDVSSFLTLFAAGCP